MNESTIGAVGEEEGDALRLEGWSGCWRWRTRRFVGGIGV